MRYASLCSGIGALDLVVDELFGAELAWYCEVDKDASKVMARHWPGVPNLGDIKAVDWSAVEPVDLLCGGPPCQSVSLAGKRLGPADERFLWPWVLDAVDRLRPGRLVFENPPGIAPWLPAIVRRLAALGFVGRYGRFTADSVGACHRRERVFIVAENPERCGDRAQVVGDQAERAQTLRSAGGPGGSGSSPPADAGYGTGSHPRDSKVKEAETQRFSDPYSRDRDGPPADTFGQPGRLQPVRVSGGSRATAIADAGPGTVADAYGGGREVLSESCRGPLRPGQ